MNRAKLVVIDDEPDMGKFICGVAARVGFDVEQFTSGEHFKNHYKQHADVIILDLMMPGMDGIEVIRYLSGIGSEAQLILVSGFDEGVLHSAQKLVIEQGLHSAGSLNKPFRHSELQSLLEGLSISPKSISNRALIEPPSVDEIKNAIANDELIVYYQPKIAIIGAPSYCAEALVRWQHPDRGLVMPDLFIHIAEENNLIDDLTRSVLEQVMAQCSLWRKQGQTVQVAVNMSAKNLKDLNLPEKIGAMAEQHGISPSQIILEITETALMHELATSLDILTRFRMKGFSLSIDDFGTGYSSLVQLHRAPFSEIKIDRSFVSDMENDAEARTIVETVILLGHKLNMKIVAEGVETSSTNDILRDLGCDIAQGYLFAKPMEGKDILLWFSQYYKEI